MVGVPVIINHKDITAENANNERVGVVSNAWFDDKDGWYWCDGVIWDETAQNLITDKGWSVSCSYDVKLADDAGGTENNIPYDIEFLDGVFTHLAIVDNPRYERANIVFNSKTEVKNSSLRFLTDGCTFALKEESDSIITDIQEDFNPDMEKNVQNNKEQDMALLDELKKLITKVENDKGEDMDKEKVENEKVDKRDIIRQIMAIAGKHEDNEDVRTIAKLAEKLAYDKSEAGTADNEKEDCDEKAENKKVKNEETEEDKKEYEDLKKDVKEDVENKCKNSVENSKNGGYFDKMNEIYNSANEPKEENLYISREQKLKDAETYFAK